VPVAVELGELSDALAVDALRLRRVAAQAFGDAGIRTADVGDLMGWSGLDSAKC